MEKLNKITLTTAFVTSILMIANGTAAVTFQVDTGGWGDSSLGNGATDDGLQWGAIVDSSGNLFDSNTPIELSSSLNGFAIPSLNDPSLPIRIGSSDYFFARSQSNSVSGPPTFQPGFFESASFELAGPVTVGDQIGVLWFESGVTTLSAGSNFGFVSAGDEVPADGQGETFSGVGTAMQFTVVPEPASVLLGALGMVSFLHRKRC